jgi:ketosteroid isomerase-like protein
MKVLTKTVLVLTLCGWVSLDTALAQPSSVPSQGASVVDTIKQREQDWTDAMIAVDIAAMSQIVADDWIEGYPGNAVTKAKFLENFKAGKHRLTACEFGPRDVKVFGDVAVLQGRVTETRISDGQRSTIRVAYMDVWVKRGGQWLVVRSHAKKL